jgi:hypothetical protein
MNSGELRQLADEYLVPFFSGAKVLPQISASSAREQCIAFSDVCTLAFKVSRQDLERLQLHRSQAFIPDNAGVVNEKRVVTAFIETLQRIEPGLQQAYRADLLTHLERRVVCRTMADAEFEPILLEAVDQLAVWSSRLYEGHPITCALGFVPNDNTQSVSLRDTWKFDFSAVLTNGYDTILKVNHAGQVLGHESLAFPNPVPSFAPYRLAPLAAWAQDGRMAVALNRTGEILVLQDQKLLFARRSGSWHFLTPEAVVTQLGRPGHSEVRTAVLETALDVSFARSGGCIGIVISAQQNRWKNVVSTADHLSPTTSIKAKVLSRAIAGRKFQELDRRLRQELVGIDGATVINHHGEILSVGAILKIPGGSTGGARLAAAKELGKLGLGIKISQDGGIRCYQDGEDEPKLSLM